MDFNTPNQNQNQQNSATYQHNSMNTPVFSQNGTSGFGYTSPYGSTSNSQPSQQPEQVAENTVQPTQSPPQSPFIQVPEPVHTSNPVPQTPPVFSPTDLQSIVQNQGFQVMSTPSNNTQGINQTASQMTQQSQVQEVQAVDPNKVLNPVPNQFGPLEEPKVEGDLSPKIPLVYEISSDSSSNPTNVPTARALNPLTDLEIKNDNFVSPAGIQISKTDLDIKKILNVVFEQKASDLHLTVDYPITIRVDGKLVSIGEPLTTEEVSKLINQTLNENQKELLEVNKEVDLSYGHEKARFRVNAYYERGNPAAAYRLIPNEIRTIESLNLPNILYDFITMSQGLFLVTGPTGSGKSTTLAAMIQEINLTSSSHIITIEDPIEYVYSRGKCLIDQRELGMDTHDWNIALRSALRQDPDVVLIGEMRDFDTIQAALTIAETGHLVFATLHTNSASETIDRIIDVFPAHQQAQVRTQLASTLKGILSQRLVPKINGGREAVCEVMVVNGGIQNLIRENKTYQIDNIISTSFELGMMTIERSLVKLVREGKITVETAQEYAIRPKDVLKYMKTVGI